MSELQKRRTKCIKTLMYPNDVCCICANPRRKSSVLHLVLEFASVGFVTNFYKGNDKKWSQAKDLRLGAKICAPCVKRLINRLEIALEDYVSWNAPRKERCAVVPPQDLMSRITELEDMQSKIREEMRFLKNQNSCDAASPMAEKGYGQTVAREKSAEEIIADLFTYHPPTPTANQSYETIRDAAKHLALVIWKNCPYGADRTAAIRKLRETIMTANAAIALNGASLT